MTVHARNTSFQDVREEVLRRIQTRIWPQGTLLPTEVELAQEFRCSRATVNRALQELAQQGVIDRKRKSGTRVATDPIKQAKFEISVVRHTIEEQNAVYRYALVRRDQSETPDWLAARLHLPKSQETLHLECMHYADDYPFQLEERWINIAAVPSIVDADLSETGPNEWLLNEVPFTDAEIAFTAVSASPRVADFLAATPGAALFQMERITWLRGVPVTFVRMTFHPGYRMQTRY